ncbi:MAG: aminotransferase class I/II-fold pyridoxal phosphate-dependent enzyme [Firmicutes bacterium]|nr:aminotransferase class I/II-fold pyridoxal phosphate-dependent enzyme [Bacillota bacterium]
MGAVLSQKDAPLFEALNKYRGNRIVPFDVPGHKQGKGNKELMDFLGEKCLSVDVNSMKPLDNLARPVGVIKQAQQLAAEAFGSKGSFFSVNGTTAAVQAMILYACKSGDKIIMPRNVHISAINALILSGAAPVYVNPGVDKKLGISLGMPIDEVIGAIEKNSDAKAVFINNPTYYGVCSNIKKIVSAAHRHGMLVLADEAHGTHFYFGEGLPPPAMACGADMSSVSMHKTGGSLTQSSVLLFGEGVNEGYLRQVLGLCQTTSASYLLLSSLDIARRNLALTGKGIFSKVAAIAKYARDEINKIGGYYAYSEELIDNNAVCNFDTTKLSVYTRDIGLAGIEVYDLLRDEYGIQIEFGDIGNILAIISVGDSELAIERLISALYEIKRLYSKDKSGMFDHEYITPTVELTPKGAFYSNKRSVPLKSAVGSICGEFVMSYPPGIPILAPGERITPEIIEYILYAKDKGCVITGMEDMTVQNINIAEV